MKQPIPPPDLHLEPSPPLSEGWGPPLIDSCRIRGKILWVEGNDSLLLGNDQGGICRFSPQENKLYKVAPSPLSIMERILGRQRQLGRLLRQSPRCLIKLPSATLLWSSGGRLWRKESDEPSATCTFRFSTGHGPLFLARDQDGFVYWGEYIAKNKAYPTAIYRSSDEGITWERIFRFDTGCIRHVHGMFWDKASQRIWLTTGDANHESGLWVLEKNRPVMIAGGKNLFRIVQPVFTSTQILFGTDTPGQNCGIYRFDRKTGMVEKLKSVRGPVFFGCCAGDWVAFSTVVEPSHPENHAALYLANVNRLEFKEALTLKKDRWNMRLFQYGQIYLPQNNSEFPRIWFTPSGLEYDGHLLHLELS